MTQPDFPTRLDALKQRMLDAIGNQIDAIDRRSALRAQAHAAVYGEIAALTCRKMACRRARRCRGRPLVCLKRARQLAAELADAPRLP